jgi:hypothetical protein
MTAYSVNTIPLLDGETPDFQVQSAAEMPLRKSLITLTFGIVMSTAMSWAIYNTGCLTADFLACIQTKDALPTGIMMLLWVAGVWAFIVGIRLIVARGPLMVGTPTRLIVVKKNESTSIPWNRFESVSMRGSDRRGTITLKLLGHSQSTDEDKTTKEIYLVDIDRPQVVESIIRQRIKA